MKKRTMTPLDVCTECGITTAEVDMQSNEGVCFVYGNHPFAFTQAGLSEEKRQTVLAHLIAQLMLGHVGTWKNKAVPDRRFLPNKEKQQQVQAFVAETFKGVLPA